MYDLTGENELDLETVRARLRRMSDRELLRFAGLRARCARRLPTMVKRHHESLKSN
jgi:hypothetical protein